LAGTEIYTQSVAAAVSQFNCSSAVVHQVVALNQQEGEVCAKTDEHGTPVFQISGGVRNLRYSLTDGDSRSALFLRGLAKVLDQVRPDIVHIQHLLGFPVQGTMRLLSARRVPVVMTLHDYWLICPTLHLFRSDHRLCVKPVNEMWSCLVCSRPRLPLSMLDAAASPLKRLGVLNERGLQGALGPSGSAVVQRHAILKQALRPVALFLSPSRFLRDRIEQSGFRLHPSVVLPLGHDVHMTESGTDKRAGYDGSRPLRLAFLGSLVFDKGVHVAIEAMEALERDVPGRVHLDIFGAGPAGPYIDEIKARASKTSSVEFRGRFSRGELSNILSTTDCVLVPSVWYENAPLVISEAFSFKVPVLASDLGGMAELLGHGRQGGALFLAGDPRSLASRVRQFVERPESLAEIARTIPPVPTVSEHVRQLVDIYQNVGAGTEA
jgi:glycosyltransferase involved in cell wall biosynthesis